MPRLHPHLASLAIAALGVAVLTVGWLLGAGTGTGSPSARRSPTPRQPGQVVGISAPPPAGAVSSRR